MSVKRPKSERVCLTNLALAPLWPVLVAWYYLRGGKPASRG